MFNGKTHYKWPCSIAMLNYQRVSNPVTQHLTSVIVPLSVPAQVLKSSLAHGSWPNTCGDLGKKWPGVRPAWFQQNWAVHHPNLGQHLVNKLVYGFVLDTNRIMASGVSNLDGGFEQVLGWCSPYRTVIQHWSTNHLPSSRLTWTLPDRGWKISFH